MPLTIMENIETELGTGGDQPMLNHQPETPSHLGFVSDLVFWQCSWIMENAKIELGTGGDLFMLNHQPELRVYS